MQFLPNQPLTAQGQKASPEFLQVLQTLLRTMNGKAAEQHTHEAGDISDSTDAGRDMLMAADVAAQTALLDTFTATEKGLVPASGGGLRFLRADGAWTLPAEYGFLAADYTLANSTAVQRLFDWSAAGALALDAGVYRFRSMIHLTGMSATSGNAAFHLLGAGTATLARVMFSVVGSDSGAALNAATRTGSGSVTQNSVVSMVSPGTGAEMMATIDGMFDVSVAGTIVPSVELVTASAAVVKAGSFFECRRIGVTGAAASAGWS